MTTPAVRVVLFLALTVLAGLASGCSDGGDAAGNEPAGAPGTSGGPEGPAGAGGSAATGGAVATGLPCEVAKALDTACGECHSSPPKYAAPMPLTSLADVHAQSVGDPSRKVFEVMLERIKSDDKPMPPKGEMAEADKKAVVEWLEAGAPESSDTCEPMGGGGGAGVGPEALPCTPSHSFTAHALGSDEKYPVPVIGAENQYECFSFKSPFDGKTQATAWAPIIDDERVLHHWILYRTLVPQIDGGVMPCVMPPDATFVAGWAPGGENAVMPEDVGLELAGPAEYFIMQVHYNNAAHHPDSFDASGVAFCTTDTPREHTAGVVTLGTALIAIPPHAQGWEATGNCPSAITAVGMAEPLTMLASFPHMHRLGRGLRTMISRGGDASKVEPLIDIDNFSYNDQGFYPHDPPIVIQPGDGLQTTCTYDNPDLSVVTFGEKTENEMCFNFVLAYPITALLNRSCMY